MFITEVQEYGKRHQEVFPKIVILMSQKHPKTIIKIKSNPWKILFLVNLQNGEAKFQKNAFHGIAWVPVSESMRFLSKSLQD